MRRVVLIRPRRDGRIFGKAPGSPYTLMRLASLVPDEVPVEIWDENLRDLPLETMREGDLVGITAMTTDIDRGEAIARQAMRQGAGVVVGGVHATLLPEHVQTFAHSTMVGEGYFTWQQLIQDYAAEGIKGMQPVYRDEQWANLDGIARMTDRVINMMDENTHYWTPYLEITRGCPRNCSFCTAIRVSGRKMRLRPVDEVVDEIQQRRIKRFFLTDDNFGLNFRTDPAYIEQVFRALEPLPIHSWTTQTELIIAQHPDLLDLARHAHLDKFFIGFESINPDNRRDLGGKTKGQVSDYKRIVRTIHEHGMNVVGLFVFGFDHDTVEVFEKTWQFIREAEFDSVSVTVLTPFPATPQREQLIEQGRLLSNIPWSHYDTSHVTFRPALMTAEQLRAGYDWLCRQVYAPRQIATRGWRTLGRYPLRLARAKAFSSFSTDIGYRNAYAFRSR